MYALSSHPFTTPRPCCARCTHQARAPPRGAAAQLAWYPRLTPGAARVHPAPSVGPRGHGEPACEGVARGGRPRRRRGAPLPAHHAARPRRGHGRARIRHPLSGQPLQQRVYLADGVLLGLYAVDATAANHPGRPPGRCPGRGPSAAQRAAAPSTLAAHGGARAGRESAGPRAACCSAWQLQIVSRRDRVRI